MKEIQKNICLERGHHKWKLKNIEADEENYAAMVISITCEDCGLRWMQNGDWEEDLRTKPKTTN